MAEVAARLRLTRSLHHGGMLHLRCERAGLGVVAHRIDAGEVDVIGDESAVRAVVARRDGEGVVEVVRVCLTPM